MFRVLIRDAMSPIAKEMFDATGKIEAIVDNDKATAAPDVLSDLLKDFDGLAVRSGTKVTEKVIKGTPRLKVIGRAGVGVDNIDLNAATRKGIVVMNAPGGNVVTTAEHTISMIMALARNIPQATVSLREGKWEKKKLVGVEITGKTLGIIGLGQIGRIVANRARGLKMKVTASDPYVSREAAKKLDVRLVSFEDLLETSDFISLHVPRLKETANMINAGTLSRTEPPDASLKILKHPRVVLSPHLGASTGEAQDNVAKMIAEQMTAYLLEGIITNAVNFPSVSMEEMDRLRPYLSLAEKMGSLMGQLIRSPHDIMINYSGDITGLATKPVTHALLKGLLGVYTDKPINYVNAMEILRQGE